jgi:hydroxymethylglutaryl-CoA reductase
MDSQIPGFYKKNADERLSAVKEFSQLSDEDIAVLKRFGSLDFETANRMIENVVSTHSLPMGIATNFKINGTDYLIPMVLEEPSVVAAASFVAKLSRNAGGFNATASAPIMIGQIQLVGIPDVDAAIAAVEKEKHALITHANEHDPAVLVRYGGGLKDIELRKLETMRGDMLIIHLLVDCRDAMGANAVNTLAEALAPKFEQLTGGEARLKIISNLAVYRTATAQAVWKKEDLAASVKDMDMNGEEIVERILDAYAFAEADPYRASTHNKGIMNGIDAVILATGNDFRAFEAGAHTYATRNGGYKPLTQYSKDANGDLVGKIEIPVAVGTIGGSIRTHPTANIALKILQVKTSQELGMVLASVGLAQNFAAMRALATEGIQRGHMKLHAANIAVQAGAQREQIQMIVDKMIADKNIKVSHAQDLLKELGEKK